MNRVYLEYLADETSDYQGSIQKQLDELAKGDAAHFGKTISELTDVRGAITNLEAKLLAEASQSMRISPGADQDTFVLDGLRAELACVAQSLEAVPQRTPADLLVLNRLHFGTLYSRFDSIHDAKFDTFAWLLEDEANDIDCDDKHHEDTGSASDGVSNGDKFSKDDEARNDEARNDETTLEEIRFGDNRIKAQARQAFHQWLRSGSGVFHISGIPGSGKSTLMKLFAQDNGLKDKLGIWAEEKKLVFASFFFWISGDDQQCSLEGLYRSLLFETLKMCPSLVKTAFPDFWRAAQVSHVERAVWHQTPFRLPELRQAIQNLIQSQGNQGHRFCFFIDGLDEYKGDSNDHWELAQLLLLWTESQDVKLCVSSRPHQEFLDIFDAKQRLHLHVLTEGDIRLYVSETVSKEHVDHIDPVFIGKAINLITRNAEGVFLWAMLVVRSLVQGIRRHDSTRRLHQRIDQTPGDLQTLFRQLLDGIAPEERQVSAQMLILAAIYAELDIKLLYWLEDLADPAFPFETQLRRVPAEQSSQGLEGMETRVRTLSGGLLEVRKLRWPEVSRKGQKAVFFHRTVRDFLLQPDVKSTMEHRLRSPFDVDYAYERLCFADIKFTEAASRDPAQLIAIIEGRVASRQVLAALSSDLGEPNREDHPNVIPWCGAVSGFFYRQKCKMTSGNGLSCLHMLAYYQQRDYVLDEVKKVPGVCRQRFGVCLLLSAYLGQRNLFGPPQPTHFVRELIAAGETLNDPVALYSISHSDPLPGYPVPGWVAFFCRLGNGWLHSQSNPGLWADLGMMLDVLPNLDICWEARSTFGSEPVSFTLEDMIVWSKPLGMDVLMAEIIRRRSGNGWSLSRMIASWIAPAKVTEAEHVGCLAANPADVKGPNERYRVSRIVAGGASWELASHVTFRVW